MNRPSGDGLGHGGPESGWGRWIRHPFWQAVLVLVLSFLLLDYGIPYALPVIGIPSAPIPDSVLLQFMLTILVGVLLYVSADQKRWEHFQQPIHQTLGDPTRGRSRMALMLAVPLLAGFLAYQSVRPNLGAPATLRSIHPAPPRQLTFRGQSLRLQGLENPLRHQASLAEHYELGKRLYGENCVPCHGDRLDGQGPLAYAFNPVPLAFTGTETIDQLQESYVFWRITKGGPGLPNEGAPWNSAMPAWENVLTADEIWSVIIFLYEQTGATPRTWESSAAEEEGT